MRAKRWRAASLKQGCRSNIQCHEQVSPSHIAVTHGRCVLGHSDHRIDDPIEQLLGAAISDVQQPRPVHAVVNGKAHANQRYLQFPRESVAFAVADGQVEVLTGGVGFDLGEVHPFDRRDIIGKVWLHGDDLLAQAATLPTRRTERRHNTDLCQQRSQSHDKIVLAIENSTLAENVFVCVNV